jgi:hypothetical protein
MILNCAITLQSPVVTAYTNLVKVKISLYQATEVHSFVRRRCFHIFYKVGSQMAVKLTALLADRPLTPRKILGIRLYLKLCRPQGYSAGIEPVTFLLVESATVNILNL